MLIMVLLFTTIFILERQDIYLSLLRVTEHKGSLKIFSKYEKWGTPRRDKKDKWLVCNIQNNNNLDLTLYKTVEEFLGSKTLAKPSLMHQATPVPKQQVISQHTLLYMRQQLFIAGSQTNLKSHQIATLSLSIQSKPLYRAGWGWCHTCHQNN